MSVILDALKRVQDESRRRDGESSSRSRSTEGPNSDAMLRRLHTGSRPERSRTRDVSPAIWVAAIGVAILALVAVGLWWLVPAIQPARNIDQQPLLADLTAESSAAGESTAETTTPPAPPADRTPSSGEGGQSAAAATDTGSEPSGTDSPDMSDLSAGVRKADPVPPPPSSTTRTADREPGYLRGSPGARGRTSGVAGEGDEATTANESTVEAPQPAPTTAPAGDDSFLEITSDPGSGAESGGASRPAPATERQSPRSPSGSTEASSSRGDRVRIDRRSSGGQRAGGLVDPGLRSAFQEGVRYHKSGDLQSAEAAYKRALELDPKNAKVNANLGVLYESEGKLDAAERHLRTAIANEPDNAFARNNLGVVLYRKGNLNGALTEFKRALALKPDNLDAYTNMGLIYTRWREYDKAEAAFLDALAVDPRHALSQYNLGLVYEEMGQVSKAVDRYRAFLQVGGSEHPELVDFLVPHVRWLESRTGGQLPPGR